ncbi:PREDICTED: cytoplasmic tRNA 2-thiolation protein 2 isoform X2 [Nelumbo nucifera]|uniref:Cytoplasmic tRNA 2-thiolation protein 2 n=1 Tax=Nelumbo nucifera TaxID=4432 RepID=A0A1U7ZFC7_NELNU|nr:PREDICTED: cytoplasmic tRNA 2-thiolation protein 2 isoform X2 [Nelumbo nucifera]
MACTTGVCQSGCYKEDDDEAMEFERRSESATTTTANGSASLPVKEDSDHRNLCFKCKVDEAITGDEAHLCLGCFRSSLFGKFKFSVTSHDMINPFDNILVAFSGGPSSRVVLQFVHEMQQKAQRNFDASRDRSLPVFGVGVAFIDETVISSIPSHEYEKAIQDIRLIVSSLAPPEKKLHIVPIENIYSLDSKGETSRLKELLHAIDDDTGKEDLVHHLHMMSLQKIALDNGYNKLVLGSCASRIACHVISATVKGQGYSLPADIQYVDARWEIPVVLPLRDCLIQELNMICSHDSLKIVKQLDGSGSGINVLVSSFVTLLQKENPSRERTIVRTAEKLTPFHFNRLPETDDPNNHVSSRRRHKKFNPKSNESIPSELFCPICNSPLNKVDSERLKSNLRHCETSADILGISCCSSCQFQILPKKSSSKEHFYSLLPQPMIDRAKYHISRDQDLLRSGNK